MMKKGFLQILSGWFLVLLLLMLPHSRLCAQSGLVLYRHQEKPLQLRLNGSMQFWLRHTAMNPGSLVHTEPRSSLVDLSVRRYRLNFNGQLSDRLRFFFSLGNNNLNYYSLRQDYFRILDAYADYQLNDHLGIGFGKSAWTGLSRYSAPSTTQTLAYDINFAAIPFIEIYDDLLRRPAVYARGQHHRLDYRLVLARPAHRNKGITPVISENALFSDRRPLYQLSSYVKYQLLEKEGQGSPFAVGTYAGKKNIFNVGLGALHQPHTSWQLQGEDTLYQTATSLALDLFYDVALSRNRAFTAYAALFHHRLGKNFIRNIGVNNPATGHTASAYLNASGNSAPLVGSGNIFYMQLGYLTPANRHNTNQLQPFFTYQHAMLQALDNPSVIIEGGFNYYLNSHNSKISLGYQNRPVFIQQEHTIIQDSRKGMAVLQYQFIPWN